MTVIVAIVSAIHSRIALSTNTESSIDDEIRCLRRLTPETCVRLLDRTERRFFLFHESIRKRVKYTIHFESKNKTTNTCPQLHQMLTDFQTFLTDGLGSKFATNSCLNIPPRITLVATLPCEI